MFSDDSPVSPWMPDFSPDIFLEDMPSSFFEEELQEPPTYLNTQNIAETTEYSQAPTLKSALTQEQININPHRTCKPTRGKNLPWAAKSFLLKWIDDNRKFPYLSPSEVTEISRRFGITNKQISRFMVNTRCRMINSNSAAKKKVRKCSYHSPVAVLKLPEPN